MNTQKKSWSLFVATLGPIGYLQAPGTIATLATMPLMYLLRTMLPDWIYVLLVIIALFVSLKIITRALEYFKEDQDPSQIVLDEFLGCLITFTCVPLCWQTLIAGFVLFRLFDITKWFGIRYAEQLIGALGVIADDVLAALLANILLRVAYMYITGLV